MDIDRTARRVLGSLIEKQWTTPEQYPLTQNALLLACNQKSNRDPEMQIEDFILTGCLQQLRIDGLVSVVERDVGRTLRYAERLSEKLDLSRQQQAIVAELMLRGPQTVTELHRRCERMAHFETEGEVEGLLRGMADRHWAQLLPRETGQRHARWTHLFTPASEAAEPPHASHAEHHTKPVVAPIADVVHALHVAPGMAEMAAKLANEVEVMRAELARMRQEIQTMQAQIASLGARSIQ